jgi:hypothetical protein
LVAIVLVGLDESCDPVGSFDFIWVDVVGVVDELWDRLAIGADLVLFDVPVDVYYFVETARCWVEENTTH